jgi:hypothetical protein
VGDRTLPEIAAICRGLDEFLAQSAGHHQGDPCSEQGAIRAAA